MVLGIKLKILWLDGCLHFEQLWARKLLRDRTLSLLLGSATEEITVSRATERIITYKSTRYRYLIENEWPPKTECEGCISRLSMGALFNKLCYQSLDVTWSHSHWPYAILIWGWLDRRWLTSVFCWVLVERRRYARRFNMLTDSRSKWRVFWSQGIS